MIFFDYLALLLMLILVPFNRQAILFVIGFIFSLVFYHTLGFSSENGGLIFSSATAITYLCLTIISSFLKFDNILILSFVTYWLTYFSASIDYTLSDGPNFFDMIFPFAITTINFIAIIKLHSGRGPMISFNEYFSDIMNRRGENNGS